MSAKETVSKTAKPPRQAKGFVLHQNHGGNKTATKYRLKQSSSRKDREEIPWSHFVCDMSGRVIVLRKTRYCNEDATATSFNLQRRIYGRKKRVSTLSMQVEEIEVPATRGMTAVQIAKHFGWPIVQDIRHSSFIR